jgi:hypothetical protein
MISVAFSEKHGRQPARCLAAPELLAETPREQGLSLF